MEFIKHKGDLQCSNSRCNKVSDQRVIYYCWHEQKQIYWFVCDACGEWTELSFGYEENGKLSPHIRRENDKIRKFVLSQYGATW
jgi:hypothetical protein